MSSSVLFHGRPSTIRSTHLFWSIRRVLDPGFSMSSPFLLLSTMFQITKLHYLGNNSFQTQFEYKNLMNRKFLDFLTFIINKVYYKHVFKGDMTQKMFSLYSLSSLFLSLILTLNLFNKCLITRHSGKQCPKIISRSSTPRSADN